MYQMCLCDILYSHIFLEKNVCVNKLDFTNVKLQHWKVGFSNNKIFSSGYQ